MRVALLRRQEAFALHAPHGPRSTSLARINIRGLTCLLKRWPTRPTGRRGQGRRGNGSAGFCEIAGRHRRQWYLPGSSINSNPRRSHTVQFVCASAEGMDSRQQKATTLRKTGTRGGCVQQLVRGISREGRTTTKKVTPKRSEEHEEEERSH